MHVQASFEASDSRVPQRWLPWVTAALVLLLLGGGGPVAVRRRRQDPTRR